MPIEPKKALLSIIVPIYNEAPFIQKILDKIEAVKMDSVDKEIILVESGSTDGSREIVQKLTQERNYKLILEEKPQGKGLAVRKGFRIAKGDILMIQDADLEYDPADYPELVKPILEGRAKFVLGSRRLGAGTYNIRDYDDVWYAQLLNLGSTFLNFIFYILYGTRLTDPQTMYKLFHKNCLDKITLVSDRFDLDWEIVCKFVQAGYKPVEVPVSYRGRSHAEGKKIRVWPDAWFALKAIIKFRF